MLAGYHRDAQLAFDASELPCSRVGHDADAPVARHAVDHDRAVQQDEAALAAVEGSTDFLEGDIGARFRAISRCQHFAPTRSLDGAVVALVERNAGEAGRLGIRIVGLLRGDLDVEIAVGLHDR